MKCQISSCTNDALEDLKKCDFHNKKDREYARRYATKKNATQEEAQSGLTLTAHQEHSRSKEVTLTAQQVNTEIKQRTEFDQDGKKTSQEIAISSQSHCYTLQRKTEERSLKFQQIYLNKLKAEAISLDPLINKDLKKLLHVDLSHVLEIRDQICFSFVHTYITDVSNELAEDREFNREIRHEAKLARQFRPPTANEYHATESSLTDEKAPLHLVRTRFGHDIAMLILHQKLNMQRFQLTLVSVIGYPRHKSEIYLDGLLATAPPEYNEWLAEDVIQADPKYMLFAHVTVRDIFTEQEADAYMLAGAYAIYLQNERAIELRNQYTAAIDTALHTLKHDTDFTQHFFPAHFLTCKEQVERFDKLYQACEKRN